jgi:hypothetical protein
MTNKVKLIGLGLLPLMVVYFTLIFMKSEHHADARIVGTWVSDTDSKWMLTFTSDSLCYSSYDNEGVDTSSYTISNKTPQCGHSVPVTNDLNYLQLQNISDPNDLICYEIYGLTDSILSIRPIDNGKFFVFDRR